MNRTLPSAKSTTSFVRIAVWPMCPRTSLPRVTTTTSPVSSSPSAKQIRPRYEATVVLPVPEGPSRSRWKARRPDFSPSSLRRACTRRKSAFLRTWRLISSRPTSLSSISWRIASISSRSDGPSMISSSSARRAFASLVSSRARRSSGALRASRARPASASAAPRAVPVLVQGGERLVDHRQAAAAVGRPDVLAHRARGEQRLLGLVQAAQADQRVRHPDPRGDRGPEVLAEQAPAHLERVGEALDRRRASPCSRSVMPRRWVKS